MIDAHAAQTYREALVSHGRAIRTIIDSLTPDQAQQLRAMYPRLDLYPIEFVEQEAAKLRAAGECPGYGWGV